MRSALRWVIFSLALTASLAASPPIINRVLLFGDPEITDRFQEPIIASKATSTAQKVDSEPVGVPVPEKEPKPGIYKYSATIAANGQQMSISLQTEIKDDGVNLIFIDTMTTPIGEDTDTATVSKGSLLIKSRLVKQGSLVIDTKYDGAKVTGKISRNGIDNPVEADLGGPAFAEAAGAPFVIGSLPLKEGYASSFRNFDLQKQKLKIERLAVAGSESINVPAGTFNCYKVDVTNLDDPAERVTYWVAKTTRAVVRIEAKVPSMGGATMKAELQ